MANGRVRFDGFEADLGSGELWREGVPVPLQDLPFRLLAALLTRPNAVVSRAELAQALWGSETFVDAVAGLNTAVAKLRDALGDRADQPRFIETIPRRGYRFIAPIQPLDDGQRTAVSEPALPSVASAVAPDPVARQRLLLPTVAAVALILVTLAGVAGYRVMADRRQVRVAVMLFDDETKGADASRLAQSLTDATVDALTAERRLAVIGNAAVLRTARPFRDIQLVRDALDADYIIIGQVQNQDASVIVRTHLIRAEDQAHVWVDMMPMTSTEAALQSEVAARVRRAMVTRLSAP
jgi:DNA-binding winged helix-turn-helix (wHTH) protein/TolB-like protein